jgi:hypothetical protein
VSQLSQLRDIVASFSSVDEAPTSNVAEPAPSPASGAVPPTNGAGDAGADESVVAVKGGAE